MKSWCGEHPILEEDFLRTASDAIIPWSRLDGCSVLITGATGLIGSLLVKTLLYRADRFGTDVNVIAQVRSLPKAEHVFAGQKAFWGSRLTFLEADVLQPYGEDVKADFIIHTASSTVSKDFVEKPVDVIETTLQGTRNILELARRCATQSTVYLSSMEVYGKLPHERVTEKDSGYLNPLAIRSSYPQSKRMAECLCAAYAAQHGVHVSTARLTQTFGAGVQPTDNRVFAQFARSAMQKKDIVLFTTGQTKRDYLYTADAVRGILSILLLGKPGEAYNISNPASYITIYDMALLCREFGAQDVRCELNEQEARKYNEELHICLDNSKLDELNPFERVGLKEMYKRMIAVISGEK